MERRTSLRKAIRHDALILLDGGAKWPCTISDFCNGGMYLTYSITASKAIAAALASQTEQAFTVKFLGEKGQDHTVRVAVARKIESATGVRFVEDNPQAVNSLVQLSTKQRERKVIVTDYRPIVDACVKEIFLHSAPQIEEVFPALVAKLKDEALKAASDQQANLYIELTNQLKRKQEKVAERFLNALSEPVGFLHGQYAQQNEVADHLSIVDKNEFEDWLTSRVLITKSESRYHGQLLPLRIRLDAIGLGTDEQKYSIFGPELFVLAYRHAIHAFISNGQVERLLFKVFENSFMQNLEALYDKLNEILVKHGVLPDLDVTKQIKKGVSSSAPKPPKEGGEQESETDQPAMPASTSEAAPPRTHTSRGPVDDPFNNFVRSISPPRVPYGSGAGTVQGSPASDTQGPANAMDHSISDVTPPFDLGAGGDDQEAGYSQFQFNHEQAEAAFEKVKGLIRSLHTEGSDEASESAQIAQLEEKFSSEEVQKGLQALQAASIAEDEAQDDRRLLDRVLGNLADDAGEQKGIGEEQQVAIDVVDRFFVSLKHNPRLTNDAIDQLNKLEIPVLKVLLKEENFFSENNHAVRQVMNRIAQLGAKGSRLNPSSQAKVEALVRRIVESFDQDTGVFDEVLESLDDMVDRQSKLYTKNVERVAAAAEGVYRVDQAKAAVVRALNERLGGKPIPKAVQTLIDHGWKELLNLIHIKHGADSAEWNEHLAIVDTLLDFSEHPESSLDMKTLLPKIQEGLKTVSGMDTPPEAVRQDLKRLIQEAPSRQQEMVPPKLEQVEESEETRESRNAEVLRELKPWIKRVRAILLGTWLKLHKEGQEIQYMRLVWVAKGYSKFVFVNHQGMKVIELGLFKLARYLRDKIIEPDPDYELPIVNQGLDDMIKDVYDKLAYESSHDDASHLLNYSETCRRIRQAMASGDRHGACGLLCFRIHEVQGDDKRAPGLHTAKRVGEVLNELCSSEALVGRLNSFDFVVFSIGDDMDLLNVRSTERLSLLKNELSEGGVVFGFEIGDHRGTLGFNNPESLIEQASCHLEPLSEEEATLEQTAVETSDVIKGASGTTIMPAAVEEDIASIEDKSIADKLMPLESFSGFSQDFFEVFYQRAIGISERSAESGQCELLCSEKGSGLSFVPELRKEAQALDRWWLDRLLSRYQNASPEWDGLGEIRIKLSGYALRSDEVFEALSDYAENGLVSPEEVWFDIYDSADIDDVHAAADRILNLNALGYRFCLDQFGTVRAPFYLMKSLPVQMIKIDESYVDAMNKDDADEGPTGSIVEVAHYLGRDVLVSSVDSAICLQRMRKLGIDYAQGTTIADYELLEG
jgi:EAL domain-containing protein (putative c-di-GMP-specific phosphodiesterase class I)